MNVLNKRLKDEVAESSLLIKFTSRRLHTQWGLGTAYKQIN